MNIAYGSSNNFSWPGWHQSTYNPAHFDHILITNELFDAFENEGSSIQTIRLEEYFDNGWTEYENYISDHRPVGLRLKFSQ
jgi:SAM-dependent MidA family methyltransferase